VAVHAPGATVTITCRPPDSNQQDRLPWHASSGESGMVYVNYLRSTIYRCAWMSWFGN
jgi:hypothetical protein